MEVQYWAGDNQISKTLRIDSKELRMPADLLAGDDESDDEDDIENMKKVIAFI